jgi:hypothetical protein
LGLKIEVTDPIPGGSPDVNRKRTKYFSIFSQNTVTCRTKYATTTNGRNTNEILEGNFFLSAGTHDKNRLLATKIDDRLKADDDQQFDLNTSKIQTSQFKISKSSLLSNTFSAQDINYG